MAATINAPSRIRHGDNAHKVQAFSNNCVSCLKLIKSVTPCPVLRHFAQKLKGKALLSRICLPTRLKLAFRKQKVRHQATHATCATKCKQTAERAPDTNGNSPCRMLLRYAVSCVGCGNCARVGICGWVLDELYQGATYYSVE